MQIEIRDPQLPWLGDDDGERHELVLTYYTSPDGKTRHSQVLSLTYDDLVALGQVLSQWLSQGEMQQVAWAMNMLARD